VIATARKLGVLLHTLWVRQSDYIPLRPVARKEAEQAAAEVAEASASASVNADAGATNKRTQGVAA
ncbi:MAG: hypothetical protein O3C21_19775, partial [Verrucomicrobia bacterium]|nr:hypothetical protein [Verrucomicrobiota bacterium]